MRLRGGVSRDESALRAFELIERAIAVHGVFALLEKLAASAERVVADHFLPFGFGKISGRSSCSFTVTPGMPQSALQCFGGIPRLFQRCTSLRWLKPSRFAASV